MSDNQKRALIRFARVIGAGVIAAVIVAIPGLLLAVPAAYLGIAQAVATAAIAALDKLRRDVAGDTDDEPAA